MTSQEPKVNMAIVQVHIFLVQQRNWIQLPLYTSWTLLTVIRQGREKAWEIVLQSLNPVSQRNYEDYYYY